MGGGISDYNDMLLDVVAGDGFVYVYHVNTYSQYILTAWNGTAWNQLLNSYLDDPTIHISNMAIIYTNNTLYALSPTLKTMGKLTCANEEISYVGIWNGTCWSSMNDAEATGGLCTIGVTEDNVIYGIVSNPTNFLLTF